MLNFDDRDLVELAEGAGFGRVSLTLEVETRPPERTRWQAYVNTAWNPRVPTLRDAMQQVLHAAARRSRPRQPANGGRLPARRQGSDRQLTALLQAARAQVRNPPPAAGH
jgi:hypothetical protein